MKLHDMKLVFMAMSLMSLTSQIAFADKQTNGAIPCKDVSANKDTYGCGEDSSADDKPSYMCLEKLSKFDIPLKESEELNESEKPAKFLKGDKLMAIPSDDKIAFIDKKRKYQLPKDKIKEAITEKLGSKIADSDEFAVQFQTPEGLVKLKVKKKPTSSGWDLGEIEVDDSKKEVKDQVHIGIGLNDQITDSNDSLASMKTKITDKVLKFDENIEKKKEEIENFYKDKEDQIDASSSLGSLEKLNMKRALRQQKQVKIAELDEKKSKKEEIRQAALENCRNDESEKFISAAVLDNNESQGPGNDSTSSAR